jgi:hypothetical protein
MMIYISTPPYVFVALSLIERKYSFTFYLTTEISL